MQSEMELGEAALMAGAASAFFCWARASVCAGRGGEESGGLGGEEHEEANGDGGADDAGEGHESLADDAGVAPP